jgi:rhodanese-related sulfurtransferase
MPPKLKKGVKELVAEASAQIETVSAEQAIAMKDDPGVMLVDIRDIRELQRDGRVPGAYHAPRGMLEFWVDPESPYYKEAFGAGKKLVLFCAGGGRSALAALALKNMGVEPVCHIGTGFRGWKAAGGPVEPMPPRKE